MIKQLNIKFKWTCMLVGEKEPYNQRNRKLREKKSLEVNGKR